jgi:hypothetical protein
VNQQDKEDYINAMTIVKIWLKEGIINESDYVKAERKIMERYGINEKSIFRMKLHEGDK